MIEPGLAAGLVAGKSRTARKVAVVQRQLLLVVEPTRMAYR
jgi:hypothetical protein